MKLVITQWAEVNSDKSLDPNYQYGVQNPGYELETMVIRRISIPRKSTNDGGGNAPDIVTAWGRRPADLCRQR